jgi:glycosyltransferase involved in cell wall biosynthesis
MSSGGMRILVVSQYFWPENFRINDLVVGLASRGHDLTVLTGMPNYPKGRLYEGYGNARGPFIERFHDVPVYRVPLVPRGPSRGMQLALNYASFAAAASVAGPLRLGRRFDAILAYEPSPITVAVPAIVMKRLARCPMALWVQDLWPESLSATGAVRSHAVLAAVRRVVGGIYRNTDRLLMSSPGFVQHALAHGIAREHIDYFPNWAEPFYRPLPKAEARSIAGDFPREGVRLLYAGNLGSAQSLGTVVDAADRLRHRSDITWVLLGDGNDRPALERSIANRGLGDRVRLLGARPPDTMPAYFSLADGLLATLRNQPAFALTLPSKLQTYFACARPVIAALPGDGAELVVEAQAGLACAPDDPAALASTVEAFAALPPSERVRMGSNARRYFEQYFEREKQLDRLEAILRQMCACAS